MSDDRLTSTEVAAILGIKPRTLSAYLARGQGHEPDGRIGRTPWWYRSTAEAWVAERR